MMRSFVAVKAAARRGIARGAMAGLLLAALAATGRAQVAPGAAESASATYQPAPMPNPDVRPPRDAPAGRDASLAPRLFMPKDRFAGDGFTPGSTVQSEQERRLKPGAGFNLNLPFD
jgi:hypothetical protein